MNIQPSLSAASIAVGVASLYKGFSKWNGVGVRRVAWLSFQSVKAALPNFSTAKQTIGMDSTPDSYINKAKAKYLPLNALERSALKMGSLYLLLGALGIGLGTYGLYKWEAKEEVSEEQRKLCQEQTTLYLLDKQASEIKNLNVEGLKKDPTCPSIQGCSIKDDEGFCQMFFTKIPLNQTDSNDDRGLHLHGSLEPKGTTPLKSINLHKLRIVATITKGQEQVCPKIPSEEEVINACFFVPNMEKSLQEASSNLNKYSLAETLANRLKNLI